MVQHLSGGAWGIFRRMFEASSRTLPLLALLFLPIVLGMGDAVSRGRTRIVVQQDEVLRHKAPYLNTGVLPGARARLLRRLDPARVDADALVARGRTKGDMSVNLRMQHLSGGGLVFYAFTATFAAIDWIMSINPHWYSTLFGFIFIGGQGLSALAFTIVIAHVPRAAASRWRACSSRATSTTSASCRSRS